MVKIPFTHSRQARLSGAISEKRLGIFWGQGSLYCVDVAFGQKNIFTVPFGQTVQGSIEGGPFSSEGMEIVALIQNTFRQHQITSSVANLSLPTQDIIFRSFIIPWMQSYEIKGVVDFEAGKYVPFALNELSYTFYPTTITEGRTRRIRIVFVAIKKTILENYIKILEQAALNIQIAEPATLSLIRALAVKDVLPMDETIALVEQGEDGGNIVVVDNHLPYFVREFQFHLPEKGQGHPDPHATITQMVNEVRISLNYLKRQDENFVVKKIVFLAALPSPDIAQRIKDDLGISVVSITPDAILPDSGVQEIHFLKAHGAMLHQSVRLPADLSLGGIEPRATNIALMLPSTKGPVHYRNIVLTAFICVLVIAAAIFLSMSRITNRKNYKTALSDQLKSWKDVSISKLRIDSEELSKKIDYFKKLPLRSDVASLLVLLPMLLPDGVWIEEINIAYLPILSSEQEARKLSMAGTTVASSSEKPVVDIQGYAYSENPNEQFKLVNTLLENFKVNKELSTFFEHIDFETIQARNYGKFPATFFRLKCH